MAAVSKLLFHPGATRPETPGAAGRLCTQCGLCCNGVMFHTVKLQAGDSAKELAALGLKLKRKHGHHFILQPCPAFRDAQCSLYSARPERCRKFECGQLRRLAAGEITEAMALEKIHAARRLVGRINELLHRAGTTNPKQPLDKRCEKILAEPIDAATDPEAMALRNQLQLVRQELDALLTADFRIAPGGPTLARDSDNGAIGSVAAGVCGVGAGRHTAPVAGARSTVGGRSTGSPVGSANTVDSA